MFTALHSTALQKLRAAQQRRVGAILVFVALDVVLRLAGFPVPNSLFVLFALWVALTCTVTFLAARSNPARMDAVTATAATGMMFLDVTFITATYVYFGGAWWQGSVLYGLVVLGAQSLTSRRAAFAVTVYAAVCFAALVLAMAAGLVESNDFFHGGSLRSNWPLAAVATFTGVIALASLADFQRSFVGVVARAEERHRLLLAIAHDAIFTCDKRGRLTAVNDAVRRTSGYAPEELLGVGLEEFATKEERPRVRDCLRGALAGVPQRQELRYVGKDGESHFNSVIMTPISEAGEVTGVLCIARDVTEQRRAEAERERLRRELSHSEKMTAVGQLVSGVAHELNNPLAAILSFAEELREQEGSSSGETVKIIHEQALRARAIVRNLLSVVRKGEERKRERIALDSLLERSSQALRRRVEESGTRFVVNAPAGLPVVVVDAVGIDQVISNLVVNAAHAAGPRGEVRLTACAEGAACEIRVEDDGAGIPADVMQRLFEPFFSTKPIGQGTGLGLSVSRGIVEQHGGTIRAQNLESGGACFVVTLPRAPELQQAQPAPATQPVALRAVPVAPDAAMTPAPATTPTPRRVVPVALSVVPPPAAVPAPAAPRPASASLPAGGRLLIVDDEPAIRRALRRWFERRGWSADEAADGKSALDRLLAAGVEYALIISDLKMPGLSGIELHRRLRAERPELLRRFLFSTGDLASPEAASFLQETSCPVLEKPFEFEVLAATAARLCAA